MPVNTEVLSNEAMYAANAAFAKDAKKFGFVQSGTGTAFWLPVLKSKKAVLATIAIVEAGENKGKYYISVQMDKDTSFNLSLGSFYEEFQTEEFSEGDVIKVMYAPYIPNPDLTDEDIARVAALPGRGDAAVRNIKTARASVESGVPMSQARVITYDNEVLN